MWNDTCTHSSYRGFTIDRAVGSGMYSTWTDEAGFIKADTLSGIKDMIRAYVNGERFGR